MSLKKLAFYYKIGAEEIIKKYSLRSTYVDEKGRESKKVIIKVILYSNEFLKFKTFFLLYSKINNIHLHEPFLITETRYF